MTPRQRIERLRQHLKNIGWTGALDDVSLGEAVLHTGFHVRRLDRFRQYALSTGHTGPTDEPGMVAALVTAERQQHGSDPGHLPDLCGHQTRLMRDPHEPQLSALRRQLAELGIPPDAFEEGDLRGAVEEASRRRSDPEHRWQQRG